MKYFIIIISALITASCATIPKGNYLDVPQSPDYSNLNNWAAHPDKNDNSDMIPMSEEIAQSELLEADVFFIHPTTYTSRPINNNWNAPVDNDKLNKTTDHSTIQYQASIFNQAGRVFAPRYRQAHIKAYYVDDNNLGNHVFDIAYADVKNAFNHYLQSESEGRPFIIASHSQGTTHAKRLIKDVIDGQPLQKRLIVAYIVGMPIDKDSFDHLSPCQNEKDTNCYISWRTFKKGYWPKDVKTGEQIVTHNPLSWRLDSQYVSKENNKGAILRNFNKIYKQATDAQVYNGILWASKPKFPFSFLFTRKNYHVADMNFYYMNLKDNAKKRVDQYFSE